ncbi:MAG: sodium:solute symporter [Spirosomataceae bacterium]
MSTLDWVVMAITLAFIFLYGLYKNRNDKDIDGYLLGNKSLPWYHVGFSVMATQASSITFLSAPGQAFTSGMGFVQFYFGLPLAMIVLSITFIPIFQRLKVFTAYEFLEERFGVRVRIFTSLLFLVQRGLSTGISIYAPSIILSTIFGWDILYTNILMGSIVLTYATIGGTKAISYSHLQQMLIVTSSLVFAGYMIVKLLPPEIGFIDSLVLAGHADKMEIVDFTFNPQERYNVWSGLLGGFFLQLSYFGTDQSQVGRYITGSSIRESRLGLMMNGLLKIPMQFSILLLGILVFVYYQFNTPPVFFNETIAKTVESSVYKQDYEQLKQEHQAVYKEKNEQMYALHAASQQRDTKKVTIIQRGLDELSENAANIKEKVGKLAKKVNPASDTNDVNYIFLRFILDFLPKGLIGVLIAVIFSASMASVASAYNSLAASSVLDVYKKAKGKLTDWEELKASKAATVLWGIFCIFVAQFAHQLGNSMIELVNILGSWFYGVILGIFLTAFYAKTIKGDAVFFGAIVSQILIISIWYLDWVAFLWLNPIGCGLVLGFSWIFQHIFFSKRISK